MSRNISVGGHNLNYTIIRQPVWSPFLVFLHEGLGCIGKWKDFPRKLCKATSLTGIVYDRYGYGNSDGLEEPRPPDFLQREAFDVLPELLEKLNIHKPVILIGHSDGGSIALLYAAKFPERVKALILEAPHVKIEELSARGLKAAILAYQYGDLKERLYKYHGENTDAMFWGWANIWTDERMRQWNIESFLPQIKAPLLFLQGEDDEYGTTEQLWSIVGRVKGTVEAEIIPGCGHIPHQQAEEFTLQRMQGFIAGMQ
ncbi:MAG: alpha/beta hydrolase [Bacteroidales bacterium]|jgi:pimeloyl-ACP methyl ester carboxylesterase|nr:alpha/beta hydrolase [Bacteroidales bacterium]